MLARHGGRLVVPLALLGALLVACLLALKTSAPKLVPSATLAPPPTAVASAPSATITAENVPALAGSTPRPNPLDGIEFSAIGLNRYAWLPNPNWTQADRINRIKTSCTETSCNTQLVDGLFELVTNAKDKAELTRLCLDLRRGVLDRAKVLPKRVSALEARARAMPSRPGEDGDEERAKVEWVAVDALREELKRWGSTPGISELDEALRSVRACFWQTDSTYTRDCHDARRHIVTAIEQMAAPWQDGCR